MAPRLNPQERERMQDLLKDYIRDKQTLSDVLELTDMIARHRPAHVSPNKISSAGVQSKPSSNATPAKTSSTPSGRKVSTFKSVNEKLRSVKSPIISPKNPSRVSKPSTEKSTALTSPKSKIAETPPAPVRRSNGRSPQTVDLTDDALMKDFDAMVEKDPRRFAYSGQDDLEARKRGSEAGKQSSSKKKSTK